MCGEASVIDRSETRTTASTASRPVPGRVVDESRRGIIAWESIVGPLERYARETGLEIRVNNREGRIVEPRTQEGVLYVEFYSAPQNNGETTMGPVLGDEFGDQRRSALRATGAAGTLLRDDAGTIYGELVGGTLYVLFNLAAVAGRRTEAMMERIIAGLHKVRGASSASGSDAKNGIVVLENSSEMGAWLQIRPVLERWAAKLGLEIRVKNPHGYGSMPKTEKGVLYLRFWSSDRPGNPHVMVNINRIFGIDIQRAQKDAHTPTGRGTPLTDPESGVTYAEIIGGTLYVLFDLPHYTDNAAGLMEKIMGAYEKIAPVPGKDAPKTGGRVVAEDRRYLERWDDIQPVLERYARELGVDFYVTTPEISGPVSPPEGENRINIRFYFSAEGRQRRTVIHRAFGIKLDYRSEDAVYPSGQGTVITDLDGVEVAELVGNTLYVFFRLAGHENRREAAELMEKMLEAWQEHHIPDGVEVPAISEADIDSLEARKTELSERAETLRKEATDEAQRSEGLSRALTQYETALQQFTLSAAVLEDLRNPEDPEEDDEDGDPGDDSPDKKEQQLLSQSFQERVEEVSNTMSLPFDTWEIAGTKNEIESLRQSSQRKRKEAKELRRQAADIEAALRRHNEVETAAKRSYRTLGGILAGKP